MNTNIIYKTGVFPTIHQIIDLYANAGLKRPVADIARMEKMYAHSNLIVTALDNDVLVGISRAMTDYSYWCYLADLAVNTRYQKRGIGRQLIAHTKAAAGEECMLLLLSAPTAMTYYPQIGLRHLQNAFGVDREK
ncbi:GNAT family N-acetyltransferase [Chitinophaga horti]|uniref:GNAT family N-acetyltransferase n=1 Tax=Chitinophaga horti TaxID=2920382 RepID=A0ABY6J5N7_9BACT|nr:GNAT family N-acetyltransferase [Chitinophaga horti]UYQ95000.1 GNAT family N-acetyltransferase [Chitinophaga horti]